MTNITYNPEDKSKKVPLSDWLKTMGKTKHLTRPEYEESYKMFEGEVERRWNMLKAKHESPYL